MADLVNLRTAKKQRERLKKRAEGDGNAQKFGRTKGQREAKSAAAEKARRALDGHERERK